MRTLFQTVALIGLAGAVAALAPTAAAEPLTTDWTYQGQLKVDGVPANGTYVIQVRVYDGLVSGGVVGTPLCFPETQVTDGRFTLAMPSFVTTFDGERRFLEIAVKANPSGALDCNNLTVLSPRQELTAAPYASFSNSTRGVDVNSNEQFVSVGGRTAPISSSEQFGVHRPTAAFGGMYVSTNVGGEPFYGYAANGVAKAYHYVDGSTNEWKLNVANLLRFEVDPFRGARFYNSTTEPSVEISNESGRSMFRRWNVAGDAGTVMFSFDNDAAPYLRIQRRVAIGTVDPVANLEVESSSEATAIFNRAGSDGVVLQISNDGVAAGSISVSGSTVSYNAFSGSHYAQFAGSDGQRARRGYLLSMTGDNTRVGNREEGETLHGVVLSCVPNDPAIIGVYNGLLDEAKPVGENNPVLALAEGNGDVWVTDDGRGNIKPGDLLISSGVAGLAMLDDPSRFSTGHIVARAAGKVDWSKVSPGDGGIKRARLAVLFDRSIRGGGSVQVGSK